MSSITISLPPSHANNNNPLTQMLSLLDGAGRKHSPSRKQPRVGVPLSPSKSTSMGSEGKKDSIFRILIVDDIDINRKIFGQTLSAYSYFLTAHPSSQSPPNFHLSPSLIAAMCANVARRMKKKHKARTLSLLSPPRTV